MKAKAYEDPIGEEIRKVKEALAAKFNFDVRAMLADARMREKRHGKRLVSFVKRKAPAKH
jgi:hypothetical protein